MLNRLGLVIHWLGFLSFLPVTLYLMITEPREIYNYIDNPELYFPNASETQAFNEWKQIFQSYGADSDEASAAMAKLPTPVVQAIANRNLANFNTDLPETVEVVDWAGFTFLLSVLSISSLLISWLINFILAGHKSPLPWVANKEAEQ